MIENRHYVIWGSAGHAKVLNEIIQYNNSNVVALFDNSEDVNSVISGVPLIGNVDDLDDWLAEAINDTPFYAVVAIGGSRGQDRLNIQNILQEKGLLFDALIHPKAYVSNSAVIGKGSQILAMSTIASGVYLGKACIINHNASVDHECNISNGVHIAPGATLCGCVEVEENVMVGAGAVILPRVRIGENTIVGAGSVVTKDIPSNKIVAGNPAREI